MWNYVVLCVCDWGELNLFAENRQDKIYELIEEYGAVTTAALVNEFGVSVETIRRDLLTMEEKGLLKRVHGGAVGVLKMKPFSSLKERNKEFSREKKTLSVNAAGFIEEGDIIAVDEGSTAISFAHILKERFSSLTIVTHSLDVFNILCNHKDFEVILCGGHFLKEENAFYGELALEALRKVHVQKAFIFPSAVSIEFGICDYGHELYQMQKQMLGMADQVYILADSSKFETKALLKIDDMRTEYYYITDDLLSVGLKKLYRENDIKIFTGDEDKK